MIYDSFETPPACGDCQYFLPYYFLLDGKYVSSVDGQCVLRRAKDPYSSTPACEKFLPGPEEPPDP